MFVYCRKSKFSYDRWLFLIVTNTYKTGAHIKSSILRINNRHVAERYVKSIPKYGDLEFRFELRLVETGKR